MQKKRVKQLSNVSIALSLYDSIVKNNDWDRPEDAWKGIAKLLLSCDTWGVGEMVRFREYILYRERNDLTNPNTKASKDAVKLTNYLADQLGVPRINTCDFIGDYYRHDKIKYKQPHNLVGNSFRSLLVHVLNKYGDQGITYEEEVDPHKEFPGYNFGSRSKNPRIDIVARRGNNTVALISARWRYRHDRVDMIDEAHSYKPPALRLNSNAKFYAWTGEFSPSRLDKVLKNCPPQHSNGIIDAMVHFAPKLLTDGLGTNGRTHELKSLHWLIDETKQWS